MKQKIEAYNKWLYQLDTTSLPLGLFEGKMGLCIYWYIQSRCYKNMAYEKKASDLMDEIYEDLVNKTYPSDFENGIIGIAFAIDYLLDNGFVVGNRDEILKDVDDVIFRNLYFEHINNRTKREYVDFDELWSGVYFAKRIQIGNMSQDLDFLYKRILLEVINRASSVVNSFINSEPIAFAPFSYIYLVFLKLLTETAKCRLYNTKLNLMISEWKDDIVSVIPNSQGHRYIVWNLLTELTQIVHSDSLLQYLDMIKQYTSTLHFINGEFHSRNVDLYSGISNWALFLLHNKELDSNTRSFANIKIEKSVLWNDWEKNKDNRANQDLENGNINQNIAQDLNKKEESSTYKINVGLFTSLTGSIVTYQIINGLCKR